MTTETVEVTTNGTERAHSSRTKTFGWVPIDQCFVDAYGRPEKPGRVASVLKDFDEDGLGVIIVSARPDGRYAVIDGNHRVLAAQKMGLTHIEASIRYGYTYEYEADLYGKFANVAKQTAGDQFRALVEKRDPDALDIKAIVELGRKRGLDLYVKAVV